MSSKVRGRESPRDSPKTSKKNLHHHNESTSNISDSQSTSGTHTPRAGGGGSETPVPKQLYRPLSVFSKKTNGDAKDAKEGREMNLLRRLMTKSTAPAQASAGGSERKSIASTSGGGGGGGKGTVKEVAASVLASLDRREFHIGDFAIRKTLKSTGTDFALKALRKSDVIKMHQVEHIFNEKKILSMLDIPFLVGTFVSFQDSRHLHFVWEYIQGGELFSFLRSYGVMTMAFEYLRTRYIVYRDLKPENLLIDTRGHIKITDFGTTTLGPEIIKANGYGRSVDWWAPGIEMIAGFPPFSDDDNIKLFEKIIACKLRFPEGFDKKAKDLCKCLITPDLSQRFGNLKRGAGDVKAHAWFEAIDWERLVRLDIAAPYVPKVNGDSDTSNFDNYDEDYPVYGGSGHDNYKDTFANF
ncbi:kinase-like domain-containing protein [Chytriomyces sp. MP71]|nr:kinase-like domain-containing protein [Chytriomyces sp. MP71]